ncbi:RNA-directed DNA methylation 4-like isoform X1 [Lolium rigidum]|uniref:RNA-directed DNA methylation 4-like isoform X1 n=1 Tax=Lolium rigidum TaxID=89674 RepID=UPI001F5CF505|nr:RNA-directed DNA methylation 4-like isoform X1 [Lolium rigidum]
MASAAVAASTSAAEAREKPVVVRVKRKPSQARPDAFWLEINERPMKKAMLDLSSLSISQPSSSTAQVSEEPRVKKLLVQHVETVHHSGAVEDVLHSLLQSDASAKEIKSKTKEWNERMKKDNKQDQLRSAARQRHENLGRNARFAQIWKSRKGDNNETDETLREMCHLYDAVQVDSDGEKHSAEPEMTSFEENAILCNFLPLIREHLPSAAEEIESDIISLAHSEDSDVYDIYTVKEVDDADMEETSAASYPLLQVDDEDGECYNDDEYPYDTDDSNAEDNPLYDYPEEVESSEDEENSDIDASGSDYENEEVEKDDDDDDE